MRSVDEITGRIGFCAMARSQPATERRFKSHMATRELSDTLRFRS